MPTISTKSATWIAGLAVVLLLASTAGARTIRKASSGGSSGTVNVQTLNKNQTSATQQLNNPKDWQPVLLEALRLRAGYRNAIRSSQKTLKSPPDDLAPKAAKKFIKKQNKLLRRLKKASTRIDRFIKLASNESGMSPNQVLNAAENATQSLLVQNPSSAGSNSSTSTSPLRIAHLTPKQVKQDRSKFKKRKKTQNQLSKLTTSLNKWAPNALQPITTTPTTTVPTTTQQASTTVNPTPSTAPPVPIPSSPPSTPTPIPTTPTQPPAPQAPPASTTPADTDSFPVFDTMFYPNKPNTGNLGMKPLRIIYAGAIWNHGEDRSEPNETKIRQVARTLPDATLVCLDIEEWPVTGPQADESIRKLTAVIQWMREENPTLKLGYYSLIPVRDYWRALEGPGTSQYNQWVRDNQKMQQLAQHVDAVFPSLYTFYTDEDGWEEYAGANLQQAKQYNKPIYPFLWPQYHPSNATMRDRFMTGSYWAKQLNLCRSAANGLVIWGGSGSWPRSTQDLNWWDQTKAFLDDVVRSSAMLD